MSLNNAEIARTAAELQENFDRSTLTLAEAAADLAITEVELRALLTADGVDPAAVWQLRDYLEQAVTDAVGEPMPFTILTEDNRRKAQGWFTLREAPRHAFGTRRSPADTPRPRG